MQLIEEEQRLKPGSRADHYIGDLTGLNPGPTIIAMAGIHGNEATGVSAVARIIDLLEPHQEALNGRFLGLKGNIAALKLGHRFVDEDMNRLWRTSLLDKIRRTESRQLPTIDRVEVKKVLQILDPIMLSGEEVIYVDLHTFSGSGGMFIIAAGEDDESDVLSALEIPQVFGVDRSLRGTSMDYAENAGKFGFAFEAGTHGSDDAEENAFIGLSILLVNLGVISKDIIPDFDEKVTSLKKKVKGIPKKMEYLYKHIVEEGDNFVMNPGFKNFDKIKEGDWLASDVNGRITALSDGFLLMPLYQEQGNDGFFIVRECE